MPLGEILAIQARQRSKEVALVFAGQNFTYFELHQHVMALARGLKHIGIRKGERVAVLLPNSPAYIQVCFALFQMGAIAVPVNTFLTPVEISYILQNSAASVLIATPELYQPLEAKHALPESLREVILTQKLDKGDMSLEEVVKRGEGKADPVFADSSAAAVIIYTSGTTGYPKGVVLSHANLVANIQSCSQMFPLSDRDGFLVFLPLFHSFTLTVSILLPIYIGARIILLPGINRDQIKESIIKQRPTILLGVPAVYNFMANASVSFLGRFLNPLKICISGGSPLPLELHQRFEANYRRPLLEGYGLSEASPVVSFNPYKKSRASSVGLPVPGVKVKAVDEAGNELPPDTVGELVVCGPNVMQGYWQNSEATDEVLKDGWLYTGDMVRIDKDGYIYIVDRKKELIIVRGMNVYPREIEEVLYRHPAVSEAAVIGMPEELRGEVPKAVIVLKDDIKASEKEIKDFCREHLAAYKIPLMIEFRSQLPKTASGKIAKRQLRDKDKND